MAFSVRPFIMVTIQSSIHLRYSAVAPFGRYRRQNTTECRIVRHCRQRPRKDVFRAKIREEQNMTEIQQISGGFDTRKITLTNGWEFFLGDCPDAWRKDYSPENWRKVTVPHDWSVALPFSREYSSGTGYAAGGIGWYRCTFRLPEEFRGKRILLSFDGVYKNSQVWCNSIYKGFHPNGYTPFSYDISKEAVFDGRDNVICVRVDRTELADSRWFTGSGITRKVTLTISDPVCTDEYGVFFTVSQADPTHACVQVETCVRNRSDCGRTVTVCNRLTDRTGTCVLELSGTVTVPADGSGTCRVNGTVENPALWSPDTPDLYTLTTWLDDESGNLRLADAFPVGIRTFSFDPDHGFFLNGKSLKFKGVCVHHDAGALGAAVTREVWIRRLEKLKQMGCNAIRMSHNPHMPELYDLCDAMGFLVMDEAFDEWEAPKNKWSTGHNVYPPKHQGYYRYFPECHKDDLSAMILRDRNHPSVILWSIGNEIDYPNDPYCHPRFETMTGNNDANKPEEERRYNPDRPNAERLKDLAAMLAEEVRSIDTTHPVTLAAAFPELSSHLGFLDALDVAGYNYKEHLYAESHERFPDLPFLGSENGHSLEAWKAVTDHDYISGQFLWTGIDYLGEALGWPYRASGAGLLTLAGFEKTGYYRRMSFWSETPMAHLATVRADAAASAPHKEWIPYLEYWNYVEGEPIEVTCYTNLSQAELFLNGTSLGVRQKSPEEDGIRWQLPFQAGTLSVRAFGTLTSRPASQAGAYSPQEPEPAAPEDVRGAEACDLLETIGGPCRLAMQIWQVPEALRCEPSCGPDEILQIEVSVLDGNDRLAVTDSSRISVHISGGTLLGLESGDIADCTEYLSPMRRAYHGRLLIFCRRKGTDPVTVTAEAEALAPANITIS